ncbi:MAG: transcriptional regulator [Hyphomicrobiaceae bacterium]|nr:transcriptional regulator [Hyphomicrobiaceae bacterium]
MAHDKARFAYDGLDRTIHEKARLGILTSLMAHPRGLAFNDLAGLCSLTNGNLSRHLLVLGEAGLVSVDKSYKNNRPHTQVLLTEAGRQRFLDYLSVLEQVLKDAEHAAGTADSAARLKPV